MLPQRLTMVTLGVANVPASRKFYEGLGFRCAGFDSDTVAFFDMNGVVFGLFGEKALAEDAAVAHDRQGFRGVALAINLESEAAVDAALEFAVANGAELKKPAEKVFWGGYSGYFADPDGHLWEIAYNPGFALNADGHMQLPPPAN
ncbi:MAG: VOC family protein [Hyphomicrobiaceae bacterium]